MIQLFCEHWLPNQGDNTLNNEIFLFLSVPFLFGDLKVF